MTDFAPDVIYYRQSSWTPGIVALLKSASAVVMEINSNDVHEVHQYGAAKARYHLMTRQVVLDAVTGFVCVGNELARYYSRYRKPVRAIGNGFDARGVTPRHAPHNARPQLVFVGTAGQSWHGVDKLVAVADQLADMDFHVVGERVDRVPPNFTAYDYMDWPALSALYQRMDIGFGTLALHRKQMDEISPLKTREYLAYGLPVIGASQLIKLWLPPLQTGSARG